MNAILITSNYITNMKLLHMQSNKQIQTNLLTHTYAPMEVCMYVSMFYYAVNSVVNYITHTHRWA